jgi:hypothetical protein
MPDTGAVTIPGDMMSTMPYLGLHLHSEDNLRNAPGQARVCICVRTYVRVCPCVFVFVHVESHT